MSTLETPPHPQHAPTGALPEIVMRPIGVIHTPFIGQTGTPTFIPDFDHRQEVRTGWYQSKMAASGRSEATLADSRFEKDPPP